MKRMDILAVERAIARAEASQNVEEKESVLQRLIMDYEVLCASHGIACSLDRNTESEKKEIESALEGKSAHLSNALVMSKGVVSPYIMDINAEVATLYVRKGQVEKRLQMEKEIQKAADELVRASDVQHDAKTLNDHERKLEKVDSFQRKNFLLLLCLILAWMSTVW
jgi:hypothetical protein